MATTEWTERKAKALLELRKAYLAEVGRLAESLRLRFESGELHGYNAADEEGGEDSYRAFVESYDGPEHERFTRWEAHRDALPPPAMDVLLDLCAQWFGLQEEGRDERWDEVSRTASAIRAVAPGDALTDDAQPLAGEAIMAIYYDVLAVARARGWYAITAGEWPEAAHTAWAAAEVA